MNQFIALTFVASADGGRTYTDRVVNVAEIGMVTTGEWLDDGQRHVGSKIRWTDRGRPHSTVTATIGEILRATGAADLRQM